MKVDLLDRAMVDSDLGVVNAARCSFDKMSSWEDTTGTSQESALILRQADVKLINYLATHKHWTPFAHAQEIFDLNLSMQEELQFLFNANLSGFEWTTTVDPWTVRGSLYAWLTNIQHLPQEISDTIMTCLTQKYPVTCRSIYVPTQDFPKYSHHVQHITEPQRPELQPFTLRIHCPIFVKRQLETHRRNFVMTDIEDFSQNEVSRRYIDTEPEIYKPAKWRVQSENKKQGSSEAELSWEGEALTRSNYNHHTHNAVIYYRKFNDLHIAHEQSRMILPLSTYTTFWWTGSLKSWQRMFTLRLDSHAQSETRNIAQMCYEAML